ncbi:MAG TPA: Uma2 family endonuclease [Thermoanaerobaculia bacterium]|jgi:Uma2 family endonuclease|nr:Uma2 family endonuclease [Thermoanaerobaculia bacterium]
MAPETSIKLTYEDYAAIPDDGRRHEIIDGEHYVNPAPNFKHQVVLVRLVTALYQHVSDRRLGHVVPAPFDVILSEHDVVQPDIVFISHARAHLLTPANMQGAPDLLVEVLSTNRSYDERVKYRLYEHAGILEYWIVNPFDDTIKAFRLANKKYALVDLGDLITSPLLPGFQLRVADLFV